MVGVCEGEPPGDIQVKGTKKPLLAGENDAGQLDQRQKGIADRGALLTVERLEREYRLEDHGVGRADAELPALDTGEEGRRMRGMVDVIVPQVAQEDVGVQKRERRQLSVHARHNVLCDAVLERLLLLLGCAHWYVAPEHPC